MNGHSLIDFGERRILSEILPKFVKNSGDDCASIALGSRFLQVTTDPVPKPAAEVIAGDSDPYWLGWLLVTINASDVAASGSKPIGFLAALDLPNSYLIDQLERLLSGIQDSCAANSLSYIGGNLRESPQISAVGTAFGALEYPPLTRKGGAPGDQIVYLGKGGQFWSDCLRVRRGQTIVKRDSPVFAPIAQTFSTFTLHEHKLLRCAMDTSDGLAPSLEELARINEARLVVDTDVLAKNSESLADIPRRERLWFGWGDWAVVALAKPDAIPGIEKVMKELGRPFLVVGEWCAGAPGLYLKSSTGIIRAGRLESERFAKDSWFSEGIDGYIRRLTEYPMP